MDYVPAKSIVTSVKDTDHFFCGNYRMNIYRGCCHGCIYCDSRSECYRLDDFDRVRAKENALNIIEDELRRKRVKGIITTGSMTDPYNPFEAELCLTRGALELVERYRFGVGVITKSDLVSRDIDLYKTIGKYGSVYVTLTVTAAEDKLCQRIEPNVSVTGKRFKAVQQLAEAGVFTGIALMPVLPFITDNEENIIQIVRLAHESGAKYVAAAFGMTLRAGNREYYYAALDKSFPGLKERYIKAFGNEYSCTSLRAKELWSVFKAECERLGLLYRFKDINNAIRNQHKEEQMNFMELLEK